MRELDRNQITPVYGENPKNIYIELEIYRTLMINRFFQIELIEGAGPGEVLPGGSRT